MYVTPQRHSEQEPDLTWFTTPCGSFLGRWCGQGLMRLGHTVDVEFNFDDCPWTTLAAAPSQCFEVTGRSNRVDAQVEQVWDDGVAALRVGDALVLYRPSSALSAAMAGTYIRLNPVQIEVYPTGL